MNDDPKQPLPDPTATPAPKDEGQEPKSNLGPDQVGVRPPDRIEGKDVPGTENTALIFERS